MLPFNNRPLRIALIDREGTSWTGGLTYRKNLLEAIWQYAPQVEAYFLTWQNLYSAIENANNKVIKYPPANSWFSGLISKVTCRLFAYDFLMAKTLRSVPGGGVDLIFPGRFTVGRRTALLCWIPDFQHVHLPEMFTEVAIAKLDMGFKKTIRRATLVVLSSQNAREDFCKFAPQFAYKSRVMNFVAHVPTHLYDTDPETVIRQYNLPEKFFYLPNQFWKHKNHTIVLEALRVLKERNTRPFVVFTGKTSDTRHPMYFDELMQKISLWDLSDQVAVLGLVPHGHVYSLIRQSICVLNPSLFEGWSTTVEETRSVGKRVLLSDIAVHREQDPPAAFYFDPHSAEDLANKLREIWTNVPAGPDDVLEHKAREAIPIRVKNFADTFISIACEAIDIARGSSFLSTPSISK